MPRSTAGSATPSTRCSAGPRRTPAAPWCAAAKASWPGSRKSRECRSRNPSGVAGASVYVDILPRALPRQHGRHATEGDHDDGTAGTGGPVVIAQLVRADPGALRAEQSWRDGDALEAIEAADRALAAGTDSDG